MWRQVWSSALEPTLLTYMVFDYTNGAQLFPTMPCVLKDRDWTKEKDVGPDIPISPCHPLLYLILTLNLGDDLQTPL